MIDPIAVYRRRNRRTAHGRAQGERAICKIKSRKCAARRKSRPEGITPGLIGAYDPDAAAIPPVIQNVTIKKITDTRLPFGSQVAAVFGEDQTSMVDYDASIFSYARQCLDTPQPTWNIRMRIAPVGNDCDIRVHDPDTQDAFAKRRNRAVSAAAASPKAFPKKF